VGSPQYIALGTPYPCLSSRLDDDLYGILHNDWFCFHLFLWFRCLWTTLFVLISRLCVVCFWFLILVRCLFDSGWKISFEQVQIRSMALTLASLQIRRHEYSRDFNIVIFVGISTLLFYVINMDALSLFTDSSFLFFGEFKFVLYRCTPSIWMNEYSLFL